MSEIIYVCKSVNNKNVREGELKILRKSRNGELYFEFGENEMFLKKRFYNNPKDLEEDFETLQKLKEKYDNKVKEDKNQNKENKSNSIFENKVEDNTIIDNVFDKKIKK